MKKIIIGLVGHPSSGKDTVAAFLVDTHKFVHVSTSDMIRFYIAEHNLGEPDRDLVHDTGNFLRAEHGAGYLALKALETEGTHLIISGIRSLGEAEEVKRAGGVIVACSAPLEVRYQRAKERGSAKDHISFDEFVRQEKADSANVNPDAQNVSAVIQMADYNIDNKGSLDHLHSETDRVLKEISKINKIRTRD